MKRLTRVGFLTLFSVVLASGRMGTDAMAQADGPDIGELPVLLCNLETALACKLDASECTSLGDLDGEPLPIKVTVDAPNSVTSYPGQEGWPTMSRIDTAARSGSQLILQGIDGVASWQMLVNESAEAKADLAMSLSIALADAVTVAFGRCRTAG